MTTVRVYPGATNPTHDIRLGDDAEEFGLIFLNGPHALQEQPLTQNQPFKIEQASWTGGSGHARLDDPTGYFEGHNLWAMTPNRLLNGFAVGYATGFKATNTDYSPSSNVSFQPLFSDTEYYSIAFVASANYNATAIRLPFRKKGGPGSVIVSLCQDNAGSPGTVLQSATVAAADLTTDRISLWYDFPITTQALVSGTTYHVKVTTASTDTNTDHWEVGVNTGDTSSKKSPDGITWTASQFTLYYHIVDDTSFTDTRKDYKPYFFDFYGAKYLVWKATLMINGDRGTSSGSNSATTLNDTGKAWGTTRFVGARVKIINGTGDGQDRAITSHTGATLTVSPAWDNTPDATSEYVIYATPYWTKITGHGLTSVTGRPAVADKICYMPQSGGANIMAMRMNAGSHQFRADTTNAASKLVTFTHRTAGLQVMRAAAGSSQISRSNSTTWGSDLTFGTAHVVGGTETTITNLFIHNGNPYVGKEEGIYAIDQADQPTLLSSGMKDNLDRNNGYAAASKDSSLYVSWGHSVSQMVGATFVDILNWRAGFDGVGKNQTGNVSCILPAIGWLFFAIDGGTSNYSTVYAWNGQGLHEVFRSFQVGQRIKEISWQTSEGTRPRLWIHCANEFLYIDFPLQSANPLKDTGLYYHWEGVWVSSTIDGDEPTLKKLLHSIRLAVWSLGTSGSIEVDYQADTDVDSTTWTNISAYFDAPLDEVVLDLGNLHRWRIRLRLITNTASSPVVIEKIGMLGSSMEPSKFRWIGQFSTSTTQTTYTSAQDHNPDTLIDWLTSKAERMDKLSMRARRKKLDGKSVTVSLPETTVDYLSGTDWGGSFLLVITET